MPKKKQKWNAIRVGNSLFKEIKEFSRTNDRPMASVVRMLWTRHKKEVKKRGL
jgi:hypothetical protein